MLTLVFVPIHGCGQMHGAAQTRRDRFEASWQRSRRAEVFALPTLGRLGRYTEVVSLPG